MTEHGVAPPPRFGLPITGFTELGSIDPWGSLLADLTDPSHTTVYDMAAPWFHPPVSLEDMPMHKPTAPPVEIVSPEAVRMDVAPPPPSIPDCPPESAPVGEPLGTVPAPPPPKPQGLRKAKAKKAAKKQVLFKGPLPPILSASKPGAQSFAAAAQAASAPVVAAAASAAPTLAVAVSAKRLITLSAPAPPAKKPKATTKGPSRKQVLFVLDDPNARPNLKQMPRLLNKYLVDNKVVGLHAESVLVVYGGWSIQLTDIPSLEQLNAIRQWLGIHFSPVGSEVYLPMSKSFLKLIDIPYICQDGSRTTSDQVEGVMRASNLSNHFVLVGPPQVVRNSKSSDTAMAYFEVWDSQRGTCATNLVGHSLHVAGVGDTPLKRAIRRCLGVLCALNPTTATHIVHTLPILGSAPSGTTGSTRTGSVISIRRDPTRSAGGVIGDVCIFLQNVNRNYMHVDYVLEALKDTYNILFFQELPWRTIRQMVSMTSEEGDDVMVTLETFEPDALDARPGRRLLDRFGNCVQVIEFDSKEEDVNILWILNAELDKATALQDCIVAATDASVGRDRAFQAVSAAWVWAGGVPVQQSCQATSRVTAPDVELHAIRMGVFAACVQEGAHHVVLFTDHLASARQVVDPSVGSGQAQALLICRHLQKWLGEDPSRTFAFVHVRSSLEWLLHHVVHCFVTDPSFKLGLRPVAMSGPGSSLRRAPLGEIFCT
ncbi:hypothetical protein AN958_12023 [Leucoagaricus sp. SymC.cos]|nr:hypothetical protein AN958_12023 [Leucoagaricus sp. SymC.cos]